MNEYGTSTPNPAKMELDGKISLVNICNVLFFKIMFSLLN